MSPQALLYTPFKLLTYAPNIDFYSPTTQPGQLTAVVYHHTVVKLCVTPSTIDC